MKLQLRHGENTSEEKVVVNVSVCPMRAFQCESNQCRTGGELV